MLNIPAGRKSPGSPKKKMERLNTQLKQAKKEKNSENINSFFKSKEALY